MSDVFVYCRTELLCLFLIVIMYIVVTRVVGKTFFMYEIRNMVIATVVYISSACYLHIWEQGILPVWPMMNFVVLFLYQVSTMTIKWIWWLYAEGQQDMSFENAKKRLRICGVALGIYALMVLSSPFTRWTLYVDQCGKGTVGWPGRVLEWFVAALLIYTSIKTYRLAKKQENYSRKTKLNAVAFFVFPPFICRTIYFLNPKWSTIGIGLTISYLLLFSAILIDIVSEDNHTGLFNRKQLFQNLEQYLKKGEDLFVLFMDVNDFKHINDAYGHIEGDKALKLIAQSLTRATYEYAGLAFRYAGDEFVILLRRSDMETVEAIKNFITEDLKEQSKALPYQLSISIGYVRSNHGATDASTLMEQADWEMYQIKENRKKQRVGIEVSKKGY